jgi:hypothetical protein
MFSRYTRECNFTDACKKNTADAQQQYSYVSYKKLHPDRKMNVKTCGQEFIYVWK